MKRTERLVLILILLLSCLSFGGLPLYAEDGEASGVEKTWDSAQVYVPGQSSPTTPDRIKVEKPLPVVIYLHGCTGITYESQSWGNFLAEQGFIAILPDSMARRTETNCDPKTKKSGKFPQVHAMRQEEIRHAVERVRKSPWADTNNVFLMGHSEGGTAAARTKLEGFSGIIISGWRCTNTRFPNFNGIFAPLDTPILAVEWSKDDWQTETTKGSCADKFGERKKARQLLLQGSGHNIYDQSEARQAVAQFLKENLKGK